MDLPYLKGVEFPLILAPMAGVSEAPFRQVCRRMGADAVMSEFLSSEALRRRIGPRSFLTHEREVLGQGYQFRLL